MERRPWFIWLTFAACLGVVLAALGWTTRAVLELDAAEARSRAEAAVEEDVRLALWRIDTQLATLLIQENARPHSYYVTASAASRPESAPYVRFHFYSPVASQDTDGQAAWHIAVSIPRPTPDEAESPDQIASRLTKLSSLLQPGDLIATLPAPTSERWQDNYFVADATPPSVGNAARRRDSATAQQQIAAEEFQARAQTYQKAAVNTLSNLERPARPEVAVGPLQPLWVDDELFLLRRVRLSDGEAASGVWLDWPRLQRDLLRDIADLFPHAELQPAPAAVAVPLQRMSSVLPLRLHTGPAAHSPTEDWSPLRISLVIAWICVLLAASAVAGLLFGVLRLSERRAAFVSAVTHELRTPLTTFRMYAEMLACGMTRDPARQQQYFETLRDEADRLTHLVENVLAYARLERGRKPVRSERLTASQLFADAIPRLQRRAEQSGLVLHVPSSWNDEHSIRADAGVVEQILFNLVDNACKYAGEAAERSIHLEVSYGPRGWEIRIRDHGPGIDRSGRRRLFRPFSKSADEAAVSAPGVGLGLALSRRLARQLGGDLRLDPQTHGPSAGACFVLQLPVA